jgi:hypothetical protein
MDTASVHFGTLIFWVNGMFGSILIAILGLRLACPASSKRIERALLAVAALLFTLDVVLLGLPLIDGLRRTSTLNILLLAAH